MQKGNASATTGVKNGNGNWSYADEVAYPFGYGLSYTTFELGDYKVEEKAGDYNGSFNVSFTVKNTGTVAGKTPVGIYLQKPYTEYDKAAAHPVEKSAIELVGFIKTDLLAGGETKKYTVSVQGSSFKSYDTYGKGTYILEKGDYYLAAGFDAHEALNNILAAKGYKSSDGMVDSLGNPANGNKELTYKKTIATDDFKIFSTSEWSGYEIKNQLSNADTNLYAGTADQKVTYLSRNDWKSTYPSPVSMKCVNDIMVADMKYSHDVDWGTAEMPVMDTVTVPDTWFEENNIELAEGQEKKLTLAMMNGLDYDDEAWDYLLDQMNWSEMQKMLCGGYLTLQGATSVGAPGGIADDGSSGAPRNAESLGRKMACDSIMSFPIETLQAQTWDTDLVNRMGVAFGHECLHNNIAELYAPVANMHRSAYGGRNWETYSEDPVLSGEMLTAECSGIQSKGVIVNAKHFAINDQEINRCGLSTWFNEQTAREIYLRTFELGINQANIKSLMASFPRFGTRWCGQYSGLMTEILRKEWNFKGFVETDSAFNQQYMTYNQNGGTARAEGLVAGVDFWMDGSPSEQFSAFSNNAVVVNAAREACHRMLYVQCYSIVINGMTTTSTVVYETPYWESMIAQAKFGFGAVTTVCFVLSIASFIVGGKKKEEENA
jgi:beta-glucosidase